MGLMVSRSREEIHNDFAYTNYFSEVKSTTDGSIISQLEQSNVIAHVPPSVTGMEMATQHCQRHLSVSKVDFVASVGAGIHDKRLEALDAVGSSQHPAGTNKRAPAKVFAVHDDKDLPNAEKRKLL